MMSDARRSWLMRYGSAALALLIATALQLLFNLAVDNRLALVTYFAAVLWVACRAGLGPALMTLGFGLFFYVYFFFPPREAFGPLGVSSQAAIGGYLLAGLAVAVQAEWLRASQCRAEAACHQAEESERRYRRLLENAHEGIFVVDPDGVVRYVNPEAARLIGYRVDEVVGRSVLDFVFEEDRPVAEERLSRTRLGNALEFDSRCRCKGGRELWVLTNVTPIYDEEGRLTSILGLFTDVTARKQTEARFHQAREAAEDANRAKGLFLANISHELRTPMNAILGMTELALGEELTPLVRDHLQTVKSSADVLLMLLNEILDFSRMEAGRFSLDAAPFSLHATLDEVMKSLAVRAYEKGVELAGDIQRGVPDGLVGDRLRVRQVLVNLIGNAIKFTPQGEVTVRVGVLSQSCKEVELEFSVTDTGIGIARKDLAKIFQPFTQAESSVCRQHGGTGLGLAIASSLVGMMNGQICVASEPGRGSTFSFTARLGLQADAVAASPVPPAVLERLRGLPVLVVDDHATNRRILAAMLAAWSIRPEMAGDGREALELLHKAAAASQPFPLVILDAVIPDRNGFDLAETIAGDQELGRPAVLMLSSAGNHFHGGRRRGKGIAVCLEKPIAQADLLRAMARALGLLREPEAGPGEPRGEQDQISAPPSGLRVLLAEDTPANQKLVLHILQKRGHTVAVAGNGVEVIEMARREPFDVILMDVQMPVMDGFQATEAIRLLERNGKGRIPIIAMTAHAMKGDRQRCLASGMDAYLAKPINSVELVRLVESFVGCL